MESGSEKKNLVDGSIINTGLSATIINDGSLFKIVEAGSLNVLYESNISTRTQYTGTNNVWINAGLETCCPMSLPP